MATASWLCRDEASRERVLDMEKRLKPVRTKAMGLMAVGLLVSAPWMGWWPVLPLLLVGGLFVAVDQNLDRFRKPELALGAVWAFAQVAITVCVGLTGGVESPALTWLAIPIVTLSARFDIRGVYAGVAFTAFLMAAVTVGLQPGLVAENPSWAIAPVTLLIAVAILSTALMSSDLDHRTESVLDGLTGMLNRKALATRVAELAAQAKVTGEPIGVVVCDVDHFKRINDEYGHAVGDAALVDIAYSLRKDLRAFDLAYRLGGEEFLVLLPGATLAESASVAERLRHAIETGKAAGLDVTMSFGVSSSSGGTFEYDEVFEAADAALYAAKRGGRNRVEIAGELPRMAVAAAV